MGNFSLDGLQAAKRLIQMESNGELDAIASKLKKNGKMHYDNEGNVLVEQSPREKQVPNLSHINNKSITSKLPKEIVNSFKTKPSCSTDGFLLDESASILDTMGDGKLLENMNKANSPKEELEQPSNIDYSLIQEIVENAVKKYTSSLRKSILAESIDKSPTLKAMKIGNTFSFIDKNGNLYEAQLKFIKNINK